MRHQAGILAHTISAFVLIIIFLVCAISYMAIWLKIRASARNLAKMEDQGSKERIRKINRSGKIMLVFVLAFLIQWWPGVGQAFWSQFGDPHIWIIVVTVVFANTGGVVNSLAYTVIRRLYL